MFINKPMGVDPLASASGYIEGKGATAEASLARDWLPEVDEGRPVTHGYARVSTDVQSLKRRSGRCAPPARRKFGARRRLAPRPGAPSFNIVGGREALGA